MTIEVTDRQAAMDAAVDRILSNTEVNASGVRVVPKKLFVEAMKSHDVDETTYKKVQDAINFETSAAARVAMADTENKVAAASKEDLANDDYRRGISSTVRIPTLGGNTEIEFFAETFKAVPARGDTPASNKITHGRIKTKINLKSRIDKDLVDEASVRMRASLGIEG